MRRRPEPRGHSSSIVLLRIREASTSASAANAWTVLPLLAAATIARPDGSGAGTDERSLGSIARYMHGVALASLLILVPYFTWQVGAFMRDHLAQFPVAETGVPRVVIVTRGFGYYQQDLVQNDPFLRDPVVVMLSRGRTEDEHMMARYFPGLVKLSSDHRGSVWGYSKSDEGGSPGSAATAER